MPCNVSGCVKNCLDIVPVVESLGREGYSGDAKGINVSNVGDRSRLPSLVTNLRIDIGVIGGNIVQVDSSSCLLNLTEYV